MAGAGPTDLLLKEHEKHHQYQEMAPVARYGVADAVPLERPFKRRDQCQTTCYVP